MNSKEIKEWFIENNRIKSDMLSQISAVDAIIGNHLSYRFTFSDEDKANFHKIFFESAFVSFNSKISMYEKFLTIYEKEWFSKKEIKQIFGLINKLKIFRNNFVHSMNPIPLEFKKISKEEIPVCWFFLAKEGNMVPITYTKKEVDLMDKDLRKLKKILLTIDEKILNHRNALKKKIKSENS